MPLPPSGRQSERADSVEVYTCGHCENIHVALKDDVGNIFADFTIGPDQIHDFYEKAKIGLAMAQADLGQKQ